MLDVPASEIFRQGLLNRLDDPLPVEAFLEAAEIYRSGTARLHHPLDRGLPDRGHRDS